MSGDRELDVVVFGATGFAGQLVAGYLAGHAPGSVRIGLAGRSRQRLAGVRAGLGAAAPAWPLLVADSADPVSLAVLARAARVVVSTVGPYRARGLPLVQACAEAGTDYADLTGEVLFIRDSIDRCHDVAARAGARIVHCCGFDSVPSDRAGVLTPATAMGAALAARLRSAGHTLAARQVTGLPGRGVTRRAGAVSDVPEGSSHQAKELDMRVFVAGGTGSLGRHLIPALIADGHEVTASTRSADRPADLAAAGAVPVVMDGLDRDSVLAAVQNAAPEVIVHQMTSLGAAKDFSRFDDEFAVTNELRTRGTDNLLEAARLAGTRRFIAQSFTGFTNEYAGSLVKTEDDPLNPDPPASVRRTLAAIRYVDETVPDQAPEGLVLRYGLFYGHGSSNGTLSAVRAGAFPVIGGGTGIWSFCEITDAAAATAAAVTRGAPGIYNIVDDEPAPAAEWVPFLARCVGAEAPREISASLGLELAGEFLVAQMTVARGSSNAKAKRELGWAPRYATWREGFAEWAKSAE